MRYETSYKDMVENEKDLWESILKNDTKLLKLLKDYKGSDECLAKFISLLFGLRCAYDSKKVLSELIVEINNQTNSCGYNGFDIDNYKFQKCLKYYLGDIDSVFDYMDKLSLSLREHNDYNSDGIKQKNSKLIFYFNRKDHEVANEVSEMRNSFLHEGLPTIIADTNVLENTSQCHANTAGFSRVVSTLSIKFKVRKNSERNKELRSLVNNTYFGMVRLISEYVDKLITYLEK